MALARYLDLAEALRQHTTATVAVQTGFLRDAPPGMVLVRSSGYEAMMDEVPDADRAGVAARSILLDVDRSTVLALLERHGFAGGIEKHRWFAWQTRRDRETGGGLHGRRELASGIDGRCTGPAAFQSERYCILHSDRYVDLPSLIVGYMGAVSSRTDDAIGMAGST